VFERKPVPSLFRVVMEFLVVEKLPNAYILSCLFASGLKENGLLSS